MSSVIFTFLYFIFNTYISTMRKIILYLLLIAPIMAWGQNTTTLPTSTSYTPQFRYTSTGADTLKQIWVYSGSKYNRWYTATEINRLFPTKIAFNLAKDSLVNLYTGNTILGNNTTQGQWTFNGYTTFNNSAVYTQGAGGNGVIMQNATPMGFYNANNTSFYTISNLAANAADTTAGLNIRNFSGSGNISIIGNNIKDSGGKYFLKSGSGIKDSTYNAANFVAKLPSGYGANITDVGGGSSKLIADSNNGLTISGNTATVLGPAGFPTGLHVVGMDARNYGIVNTNFGSSGGIFFGRRSQGTGAAPTATLQQQALVDYSGAGYGSTGWAQANGSFRIQAAQTFTDQNQAAMMTWYLSPLNTKGGEANGLKPVMQLTPDGALNITDLFEKIGGLVTPTNTGRRPSLTINNNTSKDSTATASDLTITPTYVQKGTAGSSNILINRTETTLGSGVQKFASWQVAGAEKFSVDNTGLTKSTRVFANATAGTTGEDMGIVKNGTANLGMTNYNNATNLTNGSIIGQFAFNGYQNSSVLGVARMTGYYMGDGTTRVGDLGLAVQNAGTYNELIRLSGSSMSVGIGTGATVGAKLHVQSSTSTQMRLGYATGINTDMTTASDGHFSITPTGGTTTNNGIFVNTGVIQNTTLTASKLVVSDASKNLVSSNSLPASTIAPPSTIYQTPTGTASVDSLVVKNTLGLRAISASAFAPNQVPTNSRIVYLGDSQTARSIGGTASNISFQNYGYVPYASMVNNGVLYMPLNGNQGVSGNTTAQILARLGATIALRPSVVVLLAGTNDLTAGLTAAQIQANYSLIVSTLLSNNIKLICVTINPRFSPNALTAPQETVRTTFNSWLLTQATANVQVLNVETAMNNAAYYVDGLHHNSTGAQILGGLIGAAMNNVSKAGADGIGLLAADNSFTSNFNFAGTTIATNWTLQNNTGGATVTPTIVAEADGTNSQVLTLSGNYSGTTPNFNIYQANYSTTLPSVNDIVESWAKFAITTNDANISSVSVSVNVWDSGFGNLGTSTMEFLQDRNSNGLVQGQTYTMRSPATTVISGNAPAFVRLTFIVHLKNQASPTAINAVIKLYKAGVRKVGFAENYDEKKLVAGNGISVTGVNDNYTISATGNPVVEISGTTQSASGNTVYIPHNAALTTITIPTTTTIGTLYQTIGEGAGGWRMTLPAGAIAVGVGGFTTTAGGSLSSTDRYCTITLRYVASNKFVITTSQGTITPL